MNFINYNIFENVTLFLSVEFFILYFILLSFIFFFWIYSGHTFYYPLLLNGIIIVSLFVTVLCGFILYNSSAVEVTLINGQFFINSLSYLFKSLLLFALFLFFTIGFFYFTEEVTIVFEYIIVLWISVFSLLILICANDFMLFFLAMELQGLSAYVLTTAKIKNNYSTEAGLKYFTLNSYATGFALFGISLLYGITGTTNFFDLQEFFSLNVFPISFFYIVCLSILLIFIALFFKLTLAPFHFWAVDVYEGSPTGTMFFFLLVPKIAILQVLLRLINNVFFNFSEIILYVLAIAIVSSIIVGAFGALYEFKVKRLLVYSGISNVGFLILNFFLFSVSGLQALIFYIVIYVIAQCFFFSIFFAVKHYNSNSKRKLTYIEDYISLTFANPLLAFFLSIAIFSLSGIPPLAGFFTKLFVFYNVVKSSFFVLAFILIFLNFASYIYYVRFVRTIVLENLVSGYNWRYFANFKLFLSYLITCFFLMNVVFFFFGLPLVTIVNFLVTYSLIV